MNLQFLGPWLVSAEWSFQVHKERNRTWKRVTRFALDKRIWDRGAIHVILVLHQEALHQTMWKSACILPDVTNVSLFCVPLCQIKVLASLLLCEEVSSFYGGGPTPRKFCSHVLWYSDRDGCMQYVTKLELHAVDSFPKPSWVKRDSEKSLHQFIPVHLFWIHVGALRHEYNHNYSFNYLYDTLKDWLILSVSYFLWLHRKSSASSLLVLLHVRFWLSTFTVYRLHFVSLLNFWLLPF